MPARVAVQVRHLELSSVWETTRGAGVRVAVLDSGVSTSDALPSTRVEAVRTNGDSQLPTGDSHGTYCASLIGSSQRAAEGVAPEVDILSVQLEAITARQVIAGIRLALERNCDVISCSLNLPQLDGTEDELRMLIREAHNAGVPVVAAAGNDPTSVDLAFPDRFAHAIVVSAYDADLNLLPVRYGPWTDIASLGDALDVVDGEGRALRWPGLTSGATALVSGALALALAAVQPQRRRRIGPALEGLLQTTAVRTQRADGSELLRLNVGRLVAAAACL